MHSPGTRPPRYSAADIGRMREALSANPGRSLRSIAFDLAADLGRSPEGIMIKLKEIGGVPMTRQGRLSRAGEDSKPGAERPSIFHRSCLSCSRSIRVRSPFIRVCDECKKTGAWKAGIHA